ncbi:MAG: sigma-70 family RNA polymerase sigma factor [Synechococcaceae cyanobacterium]
MTSSRCRASEPSASASGHHQRNRRLLQRLGRSRRCEARLQWRNALVVSNLALVRLVANRESRRSGRAFEELYASGSLGLIRAVENFDAGRGMALSSFAVPYIRGAMLQEQRDREQPLHTPRRLRELQRRAEKLVEQRRGAGLAALSPAELAAALGCSPARLEEAGRVKRALRVSSLDQAAPTGDDDAPSQLDLLSTAQLPGHDQSADPQRHWLRAQLCRLRPAERDLLEGRWIDGLPWRELAPRQGCSAVECRRRAEALLAELRATARNDTPEGGERTAQASASPTQPSIASRAARAV